MSASPAIDKGWVVISPAGDSSSASADKKGLLYSEPRMLHAVSSLTCTRVGKNSHGKALQISKHKKQPEIKLAFY